MSIHKIKGKRIYDMCGNLDENVCKSVIEKMIKECEKEENKLNYRKHHNLILGYMYNKIKQGDKCYLTYDYILKEIVIYKIDWDFLFKVKKISKELQHIPFKSGIYVLECENNVIYIGESVNIHIRLIEHFLGFGSLCTKKYNILNIKEIYTLNNYPNYENIILNKDYNGFLNLKQTLRFSEKICISIYSSFYPKELINLR